MVILFVSLSVLALNLINHGAFTELDVRDKVILGHHLVPNLLKEMETVKEMLTLKFDGDELISVKNIEFIWNLENLKKALINENSD